VNSSGEVKRSITHHEEHEVHEGNTREEGDIDS
jgi:hypothetical protein